MILTDRSKLIKSLIQNAHHWVVEGKDTQLIVYGNINKDFSSLDKDKIESYLQMFRMIGLFSINAKAISKLIQYGNIKTEDERISLTPNDAINHLGALTNFLHMLSNKFQVSPQTPPVILDETEKL